MSNESEKQPTPQPAPQPTPTRPSTGRTAGEVRVSSLSEETKRIKRMRKSYNDSRKQIKAAMAACSVGTNTHLAHIKAMAELDTKERAEEVALGLVPQNLGAQTKTEFLYVAFSNVCPSNRAELEAMLGKQLKKACDGLHYSEADEQIRQQLEEEYPTK